MIMFRRRFGREGALKYLVLWLISERPRNGAEIMDEIERRSWGWWRPSPGSVYPLLARMESEGLVVRRQDGKYEISEKGKKEVEFVFPTRKAFNIEEILNEIEGYINYLEDMGKSRLEGYRERLERIKSKIEKLI
ncbi:MAG TPA: PadR family transcriptional regulator [Geobacterales bacterium]|nr:PadR family transcriptional regulator [Geobacterales bacterium]